MCVCVCVNMCKGETNYRQFTAGTTSHHNRMKRDSRYTTHAHVRRRAHGESRADVGYDVIPNNIVLLQLQIAPGGFVVIGRAGSVRVCLWTEESDIRTSTHTHTHSHTRALTR
jgi:hypothetical protein